MDDIIILAVHTSAQDLTLRRVENFTPWINPKILCSSNDIEKASVLILLEMSTLYRHGQAALQDEERTDSW